MKERRDQRHFPSFSEGLSLRRCGFAAPGVPAREFPFLFGGTFIEASHQRRVVFGFLISLPFRRDFH